MTTHIVRHHRVGHPGPKWEEDATFPTTKFEIVRQRLHEAANMSQSQMSNMQLQITNLATTAARLEKVVEHLEHKES